MPAERLLALDRRATSNGGKSWPDRSLTEADPDCLFCLCELGWGAPELGYFSLSEIRSARGKLRLPVERDLYFAPRHRSGRYSIHARRTGMIAIDSSFWAETHPIQPEAIRTFSPPNAAVSTLFFERGLLPALRAGVASR